MLTIGKRKLMNGIRHTLKHSNCEGGNIYESNFNERIDSQNIKGTRL